MSEPSVETSTDRRAQRLAQSVAAVGIFVVALSITFAASGQPIGLRAATKPLASSFPGGEHFVLSCGFSHRNNDDPIVFPSAPGRSHNHTYIGSFAVDASTTPSSLLGGRSTCDFEADSSAYWAPTLYVGRQAVLPLAGFVYYVRRTSTAVAPLPAGLKMIAGSAAASRPQPKGIVSWGCGELGEPPRFAVVPSCARSLLELRVTFPNCWDGERVDSPDHKRHMRYSSAGKCPASHPIAVPTIVVILLYPETAPSAQVASGRFAAHADFMNGWEQGALATLVASLNSGVRG